MYGYIPLENCFASTVFILILYYFFKLIPSHSKISFKKCIVIAC